MKRLFFTLLLLGVFASALAPRAATADAVDVLLQEEMRQHQIAGISLLVLKNGTTLKNQSYGVANLELGIPVTSNTVFEIGSLTKQFTAAATLILVQEKKLSLDDPISRHLKNTPTSWTNVTVRHLLTHTSGLKTYTGLDGFALSDRLNQSQFIEKIGAYPLAFPPGDSWAYCNTGYNLLGYIIENISGKSYWEFLRENIFQPLQMNATTNRNPQALIPNRAAGYEVTNHMVINRDPNLTDVFSAGAIVSTTTDLAKWDASLTTEKLLTQVSKEQMWSPVKLNNGTVKPYGFGWYLDPLNGHRNIGHSGSTDGFSCSLQRFPDDNLTVILLSNADEFGIGTKLAKAVAEMYLSEKK